MSKLNLNFDIVQKARKSAQNIALDTQEFINKHTTVSVERTILRLLGIDGVDEFNVPLPNVVVDNIKNSQKTG
ncbi:lysine 5,6-aminomutase subunit alpha TIM-barrel domain-containing protein, partial [Romboutsia sp.]|uniref:lysine 5,6-aminomutase subunit alpha TIM-barrel domain-containing protein n=1 Tax=Romboutsia sp. TaxID=1965302 RepID=UPI002BCE2533